MKSMTMCMLQFSVIGHDVGLYGDRLAKNVKRTLTL